MEQAQAANLVDILSIILSVVALVVTVIGFFASLKFYRDGVKLQTLANDAVVKIEEKVWTIQSQVGGMFEKTLDAAIGGKADKLGANVNALHEQLESAAKTITESALSKIGSAGEGERQRFVSLVKDEMKGLQERVKEVRQSAEELTGIKVWDEFLVFLYVKNADLARLLKRAFHVELGHYTLRSGTGKTRISLIPKDNILSKKLLDDQKKMLDLTGYFAVHFGEYYELNIHKVPRNSEFLRETN